MAVASVEPQRQVVCPVCGDVRWVSAHTARDVMRHERRALCVRCRFPTRHVSAYKHDAFCRWWLRRHSDAELADLARDLGIEGACEGNVAANRARLLPGTQGLRTNQTAIVGLHLNEDQNQ